MKHSPKHNEVKAILKDVDESQKRADKRLARFDAKREKAMSRMEANMEKSKKKDDLILKRLADQVTEASRVVKENGKHLGGFTINYDKSVKSEFTEALRKTKKIGEIKLDEIKVRTGKQYEFDLVALNGKVVIVGEIKFRLTGSKVRRFINQRLPHFAEDCPEEAGTRRIYGMVGGEIITNAAKVEAEKHGLFIARLKKNKIIIDHANAQALD